MTKPLLVLSLLVLLAPARALAAGETSIFYYPWYGTPQRDGSYLHWDQDGHHPPLDLASSYYPARGPYSSSDPAVVRAQMKEIARAGIQEVVSSWWGWGSIEDERLPLVLRAARAQGLSVAVQIEPYPDRTAESVGTDVAHLLGLGITRFYVYDPFADSDESSWKQVLGTLHGVQVLAQTANVARAAAAGFDGVYTYDVVQYGPSSFGRLCERARELHLLCAPSVGPGYDALRATGDVHVRPRRDGATYDAMWRAAIEARADRVTITSYNEWHEGTQIEPAVSGPGRRPAAAAARGSSPVAEAYASYDGAYGLRGRAASEAYLARTAYWTAAYRASAQPGRARKPLLAGREQPSGDEWQPVPSRLLAHFRVPRSEGQGRPDRAAGAPRPNLLLPVEPSRLMPAVRVTDAYSLAQTAGCGVVRRRRAGRRAPSGGRPAALVQGSVGASCVRAPDSSFRDVALSPRWVHGRCRRAMEASGGKGG